MTSSQGVRYKFQFVPGCRGDRRSRLHLPHPSSPSTRFDFPNLLRCFHLLELIHRFGGFHYLDIGIALTEELDTTFIPRTATHAVISAYPGTVFNAILAAPAKLNFFGILIEKVVRTSRTTW